MFIGLIEAIVRRKDQESRGVGLQNFKYAPGVMEFAFLVHDQSPQTYRTIKNVFQLPTERSLKYVYLAFAHRWICS